MENRFTDVAVIGGGPAGMAAALRASELGAGVSLIERDSRLGGILNQCVHDGFGLLRFKKQMSGAEYAQIFADKVHESSVTVMTGTTVIAMTRERELCLTGEATGGVRLVPKAIVLAMGCRERSCHQAGILGSRPAGVLTAGAVQKYINIQGYLPGRRAVILGSGDIGLIMARRMTLEGMDVVGVYEIMPSPGGLRRNIVQCLDDYGIPLHLSTTVTSVHGNGRVEGVTVAKVDGNRRPIPGSEEYIPCDLLVLSVGLIPENELSRVAGVEIDPVTGGPVLDDHMMTSLPGIFAAGNVSAVFDLVDYVSNTGELAAEGACEFISAGSKGVEYIPVEAGENVSFVLPRKIRRDRPHAEMYLRVRRTLRNAVLEVMADERLVSSKKYPIVTPPEMVTLGASEGNFSGASKLTIRVMEV